MTKSDDITDESTTELCRERGCPVSMHLSRVNECTKKRAVDTRVHSIILIKHNARERHGYTALIDLYHGALRIYAAKRAPCAWNTANKPNLNTLKLYRS